jgi:hypothetical protein
LSSDSTPRASQSMRKRSDKCWKRRALGASQQVQ